MDGSCADFEDMRRSHAAVSRRVDALEEKIAEILSSVLVEKAANERRQNSEISRAVRRVLVYATRSAEKMLTCAHPEFERATPTLCAGNTVFQVVLRSRESEYTLREFRTLTKFLLLLPRIDCTVSPSDFFVQEASPARLPEIDICFPSYADICEALNLKASQRVDGFYQTKRNLSRNVRAVQVMGVVLSGASSETATSRRIMLGKSRIRSSMSEKVQYLLKRTQEWVEGSWVHGCSLESDSNITFSDTEGPLHGPYPFFYRIKWERYPGVKVGDDSIDELVPGLLRSYFPAVIMRSNILISTVETAFRDCQGSKLMEILTQK